MAAGNFATGNVYVGCQLLHNEGSPAVPQVILAAAVCLSEIDRLAATHLALKL